MIPQPPPGQGPIDPRGAFQPPPPPGGGAYQQQYQAPPGMPPGVPPGMPGGPMMMMPPPMFYPPPPQPPRRQGGGIARAMLVTFVTVLFGASLTLNIYLLALSGLAGGSERAHAVSILEGDPKQKIAHVQIKGIIMDEAYERFERMMKSIEKDNDVKALVIEVD